MDDLSQPHSLQSDRAYAALKEQVISCQLEPGAYYTEAGLAADLGLGQTPVREALARLAQQGWVRGYKGRGYQVLPLSVGGIRDLFGARRVVEPAAIEQAAGRIGDGQAERLLELARMPLDPDDAESCRGYLRANRQLHQELTAACGNTLLAGICQQLLERSERLMHLGMIVHNWNGEANAQHQCIVQAVIDGDGPAARQAADEHIVAGERAAVDALLATPGMQAAEVALSG